jgi:hypothetical protein
MSKDLKREGFKFAGQQLAYTSFAKEIRLNCGKLFIYGPLMHFPRLCREKTRLQLKQSQYPGWIDGE